jgi:hypothetical protein
MNFYHVTAQSNLPAILQNGLQGGVAAGYTEAGSWADTIYGGRPLYLGARPWSEGGVVLEIQIDPEKCLPDLPSFIDHGAYLDEDGMYWVDSPPLALRPYLDDGYITYHDLLKLPPSTFVAVTGTVATLHPIGPEDITVLELGHELGL